MSRGDAWYNKAFGKITDRAVQLATRRADNRKVERESICDACSPQQQRATRRLLASCIVERGSTALLAPPIVSGVPKTPAAWPTHWLSAPNALVRACNVPTRANRPRGLIACSRRSPLAWRCQTVASKLPAPCLPPPQAEIRGPLGRCPLLQVASRRIISCRLIIAESKACAANKYIPPKKELSARC